MNRTPRDPRKRIEITHHAMQRLHERVGSYGDYRSWQELVQDARYKGLNINMMDEEDSRIEWQQRNIGKLNNSSQVRFFNGFAYIFMGSGGSARTLVTVIKVDELENASESQKALDAGKNLTLY